MVRVVPRLRDTCNLPGLSGSPLLVGLHAVGSPSRSLGEGWCSRSGCTDTLRVLSAPSLHWTTWAAGAGPIDWCRVRDFHPQPLRPERSVSCSWTNAACWHTATNGTPGRTLTCNHDVRSVAL